MLISKLVSSITLVLKPIEIAFMSLHYAFKVALMYVRKSKLQNWLMIVILVQ